MMKFFNKLINCKYYFKIDKKSDILVYSSKENKEIITKLLRNYKVVYFDRKVFEVNIFYLLISLVLKILKNEKLSTSYFRTIIYFVKPRLILSAYDNQKVFYLFKKYFNVKTAFIQISHHNDSFDIFGTIKKNKDYEVDHMFVYGKNYEKEFAKYIKGKFYRIGSFRNNSILQLSHNKKKENSVSFISQYRKYSKESSIEPILKKNLNYQKYILRFLDNYCLKKGLTLKIHLYSCPNDPGRRKKWYEEKSEVNFIESLKLKCKFKYVVPQTVFGSYNNLIADNAKAIVCNDSNLAYELLSRKKKVIFFSIKKWNKKSKSGKFGWPGRYPETGFFWTNKYSEKIFEKIINQVIEVNDSLWKKKIKKYFSEIIIYDKNNKIFREKIKKIISNLYEDTLYNPS